MAPSETPGTDTDEFADYEGPFLQHSLRLDPSALFEMATLRALLVAAGSAVLILSERTPALFAVVIGLVLVLSGLAELVQARRRNHRSRPRLALSILLVLGGVVLLSWPGQTTTVARIIGAVLVAAGLYRLVGASLRPRGPSDDRRLDVTTSLFLIAFGLAILAVPVLLGRVAIMIVAAVWLVGGLATVVTNLRADTEISRISDNWQRFVEWIEGRPDTASDRRQLYDKLFFEGSEADRRLSRFFILMALASAIAAYGIVSDSTATVIGAMLVAPLMMPLMATTVSLVMGWPRRASMSLLVAVAGIVVAIGLGFIVAATLPFELSPVSNAQISSRISPTLTDLAVAIVAGAAGAFGLSRPDVSESLPGVAVAIALIPPLAVTGLMLSEAQYDDAWGSFLLFSTNTVAILLAGALTFVLTGVAPIGQILGNRRRVQASLTLVGTLGILIVTVLALSSQRINAESFNRNEVTAVAGAWLDETNLTITQTTVNQSSVTLVVSGPHEPPSVDALGIELEKALGRALDVTVRWVPEELLIYEGNSTE